MRTHLFQPDRDLGTDHRGDYRCAAPCGLPKSHRIHEVPEPNPEAAVIDARILGETPEERTEKE